MKSIILNTVGDALNNSEQNKKLESIVYKFISDFESNEKKFNIFEFRVYSEEQRKFEEDVGIPKMNAAENENTKNQGIKAMKDNLDKFKKSTTPEYKTRNFSKYKRKLL